VAVSANNFHEEGILTTLFFCDSLLTPTTCFFDRLALLEDHAVSQSLQALAATRENVSTAGESASSFFFVND
jgi:hypothetical protein